MSAPIFDLSWIIPTSVITASLLGSLHCVTMCGPLIINFARSPQSLFFFHIARLLSYASLGALAGAFGERILDTKSSTWVPVVSIGLVGLLLVINGISAIKGQTIHRRTPRFLDNILKKMWRRLSDRKTPRFLVPVGAGFLTAFLPCGHLYSFIIGAVATGSGVKGAIFMAAFWLGTLPALAFALGTAKAWLNSRFSRYPSAFGYILILAGMLGLLNFTSGVYALSNNPINNKSEATEHHHFH